MKKVKMSSDRNYGIDFLRILSMFFVLVLHINWQGGILDSLVKLSLGYNLAWLVEICAYCAVNCYALISGYIGYARECKYSNIIKLYIRTVFYALLATGFFYMMSPEMVGEKAFIRAVLPMGFEVYWYFSAYFCMFFFAPFLNKVLEVCDRKQLTLLVINSVILFSVLPTLFQKDIFYTNNGFSPLWLSILYILGGYIKKYDLHKKIKNSVCIVMYILGVVVSFGHKVITEYIKLRIYGVSVDERLLIEYTSPTILICALALLCLFAKLTLKDGVKRVISIFAPFAFSVYLIHTAPFVWTIIMKNRFIAYATLNPFVMVFAVLSTAVGIFVLCSLIDYVRICIFKWLHIDKMSIKIEEKVVNLINRAMDKI